VQELRKTCPELHSLEKSGGEESFGLVCCLDGADGTGEGGLTGGGDGVLEAERLLGWEQL